MDGSRITNGTHARKSSKANGMPLTEYAAKPTKPVDPLPASSQVPEAFLLPDGFPDVNISRCYVYTKTELRRS